MATAAAGLLPAVNVSSSSFGQFRLTQFVDNAPRPPPNASSDLQTPVATSHRTIEQEQMAQLSRPFSGQITDRTPSTAPTKTAPQEHSLHNSLPSGFSLELGELAANPTAEGVLGPNKDGRVRNPVPSKLKGKTDHKQGNFGVMHMGVSPGKKTEAQGRDAAAERDAAARRTSENTASRAKAAQSGKYVPPNKRGLESKGNEFLSPFATEKQRKRALAPDETKVEQARLLTLLRSINPVTVVDQICKAVAYFGGIPGAPPPEDGIFPVSANTGETGSLFIGWLSEIFPNLSSPEAPQMQPPPVGGRKKSKAGKAKMEMPSDETPNPRNGFGFGQAVSAPAWGLPQSLTLVNTVGVNSISSGQAPIPSPRLNDQAEQRPATPAKQLSEDNSNSASAAKRGRGRPKGSTNKSRKSGAQWSGDGTGPDEIGEQNNSMAIQQVQQSPRVQVTALSNTKQIQAAYPQMQSKQTAVTDQTHDIHQYPLQQWQINSTKNTNGVSAKSAVPDELSPEELAVINAFRTPVGPAGSSVTPNAPPTQVPQQSSTGKAVTVSGVKRKRAPPKPKQPAAAPANHVGETQQPVQPVQSTHYTPILPPSKTGPLGTGSMGMAKDNLQWASVDSSTPTAPPAKKPRQRKPKVASGNDPPSKQQTASVVSQITPPLMPSTIPDSQASVSQQSIPATRPQAEGLEAHYERFASTSVSQQNGRSNTPSANSVASITPQQHIRQLQKPTSLPQSQQPSPAQTQNQLQMQRQASQQGQRDEQQKMAQPTTARSSSTGGFYSQKQQQQQQQHQQQQQQRQPTYGTQQYPSHQTSQLANAYGTTHSASPQMSNDSYRTNSTHTLVQASPQFSQADSNTYRNASPHTIPQPSPSFTQPESNFRTSSTNSLTQPSPSYSQPDNTYRAASSLSNSTPSYTRTPHTQTQTGHQSHYSHFPDTSYVVDLPTLESLGHTGGTSSNTMSAGGYGQQGLGVGIGGSSSSTRPGSQSIYGTSSGLGNVFDTGTNDLLRGVSRGGSNSAYGTSSSLGSFDTEQEMRERMMRGNLGIGGRR